MLNMIGGKANVIVKSLTEEELTEEERAMILLDLEQTLNTMGERKIYLNGRTVSFYPRFHLNR